MPSYHIAQVNIGRVRAPVEDPLMAGFMTRLDELNALADQSTGFVWRLQTSAGNATYLRPFPEDDSILMNMSVGRRLRRFDTTFTRRCTPNFFASATSGSRNSQAPTPLCGGFQRVISPASTRRENGLSISTSMDPRSLLSPSQPHSSLTSNFRAPSIGCRLYPAPQPSQNSSGRKVP